MLAFFTIIMIIAILIINYLLFGDKLERRNSMDSEDKAWCIVAISLIIACLMVIIIPTIIGTNYYKQKYKAQYEHELKMKQIEVYGEEIKQ